MLKRNIDNTIEKKFNQMLIVNIIIEVLLAIFGIVMVFNPNFSANIIGTIVGVLLLFLALSLAISYFTREGAKLYSLNLIFAIVTGVLAGILLFYPNRLLRFVTICIGIYLLISGGNKLNYAFWLKKGSLEGYFMVLINAIILLVLGIVLIVNPFSYVQIAQVIGAFLIISSALKLSDLVLFKKRANNIIKIFW